MTTQVPSFRIRTRMTGRDTNEPHRASSPLEALFDLTFVVAVAQVADQLAHKVETGDVVAAIIPFIMVFFAIWWAWMNFTWFASAYDVDDVLYRILALVQMAGVLVLAAGVPSAFLHADFLGITIGYLIMRVGLVAQWVRAAIENPDGRSTALRYAIGVSIVQIGWVCRLFLPTDRADQWWTVYLAFFVLVALEFACPIWAERTGLTSWHPHHIAERFGLFTIILFGETIEVLAAGIGAIVTAHAAWAPLVTVGVSSLILIFALWWLYFLQPAGDGLEQDRGGAWFWGYGHYFVFAALGALGAGLEVNVAFAGGHLELDPQVVVYSAAIPVALYLVALMVTHMRILPGIIVHIRIVLPAVIVVLLLPLAARTIGAPADFALMALTVALAVGATLILGRHYTRAAHSD